MRIALPKPSLWTLASGLDAVDCGIRLARDPDLALLLNCNKPYPVNTLFIDESAYNHQSAVTGNAITDTSQSKFGNASMRLDGSGDWVKTYGDEAFNFGTGDFTIDLFVRFNTFGPTLQPFLTSEHYYELGYNGNWTFRLSATGWPNLGVSLASFDGRSNGESTGAVLDPTPVSGQWYHFAITRNNGYMRLFYDGIVVDENYHTKALIDGANGICHGRWSGYYADAHFDSIRIMKGRALWMDDFTPPVVEPRGYRTNSPVAESPWVSIGKGTLDATTPIFIEENKLAALLGYIGYGTLKYQYALNSGSYNGTWLTLAQLQSALAGQAITVQTNSLRLRVQFNSDGGEAADISGFGSRAEGEFVFTEVHHLELPEPSLWTLDTELEALDFGIRLKRFDDDFANGTQHSVWQDYEAGGLFTSESPDESGGVLNVGISGIYKASGYETVNAVPGDFDVQVDFLNFTSNTAPGGSGYGVKAELSFIIDEDNYFEVHRYQNDSGQTSFVARRVINGNSQQTNKSDFHPTSGKLRLVRQGSLIQWYRDYGSGWDLVREELGFPTGAGILVIWCSTASESTSVSVDFDNFIVNEGQLFYPDSPVTESPWMSYGRGILDAGTPVHIEENALAALNGYSPGTIDYQYALNGGAYNGTWLTLEELQTALAGKTITHRKNSLRLRVRFNSDGTQAADISGFGSHVEGGSPGADFLLPLEALDISKEREAADISTGYEVIET